MDEGGNTSSMGYNAGTSALASRRHLNKRFALTPCSCASFETETPGCGVHHVGSHYFLVGTTLSTTATIHQTVLAGRLR